MLPRFTKYGRRELMVATVLSAASCAALVFVFLPAVVVPLVLWAWVLWFFRDPTRRSPDGPGLLVSPADGRVAEITRVGAESPLGCDGLRIGVFMNIFDVHVNFCPADAVVESVAHRSGGFLDARDPAASERNESTTVLLRYQRRGRTFRLVVRQVAGLVARRIVTDVRVGQRLRIGQRIGMIKFGSRLELIVPAELVGRLCVDVGQTVRGGETVLIADEGE